MKTNTEKNKLPKFCPACGADGDIWKVQNKNTEQAFRGEVFSLRLETLCCEQCEFSFLSDSESERLVQATWDAYREKHGLLTANEIRKLRKGLNMTQGQFADYLGVGEASIKRWERGLVQDKSNDELIRAKTASPRFTDMSPCYDFETMDLPPVRSNSWAHPLQRWTDNAEYRESKILFVEGGLSFSKDEACHYSMVIHTILPNCDSFQSKPFQGPIYMAEGLARSRTASENLRDREVKNYDLAATA